MYRILITLVCIGIVTSAPQDSKITYVKRHIDSEHIDNRKHEQNDNSRESKVEIVPLTIAVSGENITEWNNPEQSHRDTIVHELYKQNSNPQTDYNYSDRIYSIKTKPKKSYQSTTTEKYHLPQVTEENQDINPDTEPAESVLTDTVTRTDNTPNNAVSTETITEQKPIDKDINNEKSTETNISNERFTEVNIVNEQKSAESSETATKYDDQPVATSVTTETYEETTKAITTTKATTPRALPKLSYFEKPTQVSFSRNLIGHSGKRKFRSKCRCEKIWNCAKLQVSVARCPDEYFLCCA